MAPPNVLVTEGRKVPTPYRAEAWRDILDQCGLRQKYPNLVHDILYGSPIGSPPPLTCNFIPRNSSSASEHSNIVDKYLADEIEAGRMYGGLSVEDAEIFFGGHFRTAPMAVIDEGTKFRIVHNLSAQDKNGDSTNSWLDAQEKPTKWYTAAMSADAVSFFPSLLGMTGASHVCHGAILRRLFRKVLGPWLFHIPDYEEELFSSNVLR